MASLTSAPALRRGGAHPRSSSHWRRTARRQPGLGSSQQDDRNRMCDFDWGQDPAVKQLIKCAVARWNSGRAKRRFPSRCESGFVPAPQLGGYAGSTSATVLAHRADHWGFPVDRSSRGRANVIVSIPRRLRVGRLGLHRRLADRPPGRGGHDGSRTSSSRSRRSPGESVRRPQGRVRLRAAAANPRAPRTRPTCGRSSQARSAHPR
jgi:hypothetical protein